MIVDEYKVFKFKDHRGFNCEEVFESIEKSFEYHREIQFWTEFEGLNYEITITEDCEKRGDFYICAGYYDKKLKDSGVYDFVCVDELAPDYALDLSEVIKYIRKEIRKNEDLFFRQLRLIRFKNGVQRVFFYRTEIDPPVLKKVIKNREEKTIEAMLEGESFNHFFTDLEDFGPFELMAETYDEDAQELKIDDIFEH